ncbi:Phage tail-collar fibre protein [Acinetobacter marinus]|uniref:Phage tail-collar fibre protein n=1 Tax=Acinetobacter marinus TaxID=281375 RepID=A0A1G6JDL2_9GAMM|nr:phage tail protein [Acinetobacter marinus]SDC16747.1 Phage tail-collar fibre protein [Acinetobacter marinus]
MAEQIYFSVFTTQGLALLTEAIQNGTKLGITSMAFGDGGGSLPTPEADVTSLVNEVHRTSLNSLAPDPKNANWLRAEAIIASAIGGFNIRELGLYAGDVLVAYSNYPPTFKPNPSDGTARIMTFRMVLQIDNVANFELVIDPDIVLATIQLVNTTKSEIYANTVTKVNYVSDLADLDKENGRIVDVKHYSEQIDSETVRYIYDADFDGINNGGTIIDGWVAKLRDYVTPEMFGIQQNVNATAQFLAMIDFAATNKLKIRGKSGATYVTSSIQHTLAGGVYKFEASSDEHVNLIYDVDTFTSDSRHMVLGGTRTGPFETAQTNIGSSILNVQDSSVYQAGNLIRLTSTRLYQSTENRGWYCEGQMNEVLEIISSTQVRLRKPLSIDVPDKTVCTGVVTEVTDAWNFKLDSSFTFTKPFLNLRIEINGITQYIYKFDEATKAVTINSTWRSGFPTLAVGDTYTVTYSVEAYNISPAVAEVTNWHFHCKTLDTSSKKNTSALLIQYAKDVTLDRNKVSDYAGSGFAVENCLRGSISKNVGFRMNNYGASSMTQIASSSEFLVSGNIAYQSRRVNDVHGVNIYCEGNIVENNILVGGGRSNDGGSFYPDGANYCGTVGSHGGSLGTVYRGNIGINCMYPLNIRGQHEQCFDTYGYGVISEVIKYFGGGGNTIDGVHYKSGWAEAYNTDIDTTYVQHSASDSDSYCGALVSIDTADVVLDYPIEVFNLNADICSGGLYIYGNDDNLHPFLTIKNFNLGARIKPGGDYFAMVRTQKTMDITPNRFIDLGGHNIRNLMGDNSKIIRKYFYGGTAFRNTTLGLAMLQPMETKSFQGYIPAGDIAVVHNLAEVSSGISVTIKDVTAPTSRSYCAENITIRSGSATAYKDDAVFTPSNLLNISATVPAKGDTSSGKVTLTYVNGSFYIHNGRTAVIAPLLTLEGV